MADQKSHDRLSRTFGMDDLPELRAQVAGYADSAGLTGTRRHDFVLAVDEVITNALVHGGGSGRLTIWAADDRLWFEVADDGPGIELATATEAAPGSGPPAPHQIGGRGLWMAHQLLDELVLAAGRVGTVVTGAIRLA